MAAPVLIESFGSSFTFGGANSLTATPAATPSSDEIVLLRYSANGISTSATAFDWSSIGFTQFYSNTFGAVQTALAWKRAGGSEPSSYTLNYTAGSGGNERLIGARVSGCITSGSPIEDGNAQTFSFPGTTFNAGAVTASVADTLHCIAMNSDGNLSAPAIATYTETVYNQSFGGSDFAMDSRAFFTKAITAAGSIPNQTVTQSGAGFFNVATYSFLLLPESGDPPTAATASGGAVAYAVVEGVLLPVVTSNTVAFPRRTYFILQ